MDHFSLRVNCTKITFSKVRHPYIHDAFAGALDVHSNDECIVFRSNIYTYMTCTISYVLLSGNDYLCLVISKALKLALTFTSGGIEPSARREIWPFLLGVFDFKSTYR